MAKFFEKLSKEKLLGYFLILWGLSYLIGGIGIIVLFFANIGETTAYITYIIKPLILMAMGIILILLGGKVIKY